MKGLKKIFANFDLKELKNYLFLSVLILLLIIAISKIKITEAKYETAKDASIAPDFAFFIVDVSTQNASIRLDNIVPSATPRTYTFQVSNFKDGKRANVDLTYSIEVITTTNLPLNIKLYKGLTAGGEEDYTYTVTQNDDDVYFKHLLYDDVSTMYYNANATDNYTLWIDFPLPSSSSSSAPSSSSMVHEEAYAGTIELIDIEIKAEQVVAS